MNKFVVRIFHEDELVMESEWMPHSAQGLTALAMFEDLYASDGYRITKPYPRLRHFRAFHPGECVLLDVYLADQLQPMN